MIKDGKVRPEGCICEPCSDIQPNWKDIRTKFGYEMLCEIATGNFKFQKIINLFKNKSLLYKNTKLK